MPLLSVRLLVLLAALSLALPVLSVALCNRLRGPQLVRVGSRLGLVMTSQVCAVLLAAVAANDYGYFYGSWNELLGRSSGNVAAATRHKGASPAERLTLGSPQGRLETLVLGGGATGLSEQAMIYLPPQYDSGRRDLPVVEVMTGYPGTELNLVRRLHYPELLLRGIERKTVPPMVLVLLRPAIVANRDTECTDVPRGPQALSYFTKDVPALIAARYGLTIPVYGAIGDSTGGYCAVKMALFDPSRFRAAVSLSGYFHALRDASTGDLYGGSESFRLHNDLIWRLSHLPVPAVSLFLATSRQERGQDGYSSTQALVSAVRPPVSLDELVEASGGHNFVTWKREIPPALVWLGQHLVVARQRPTGTSGPSQGQRQ